MAGSAQRSGARSLRARKLPGVGARSWATCVDWGSDLPRCMGADAGAGFIACKVRLVQHGDAMTAASAALVVGRGEMPPEPDQTFSGSHILETAVDTTPKGVSDA